MVSQTELDVYQYLVTDLKTLRKYLQDLAIAKFLFSLRLTLMRGQILAGDGVSSLIAMYSRVFYVSTGSALSPISNNKSALFSGRGRSSSRGHDRGSREVVVVVVRTQMEIKDSVSVITEGDRIKHLINVGRSMETIMSSGYVTHLY